MGSLTAAAIKKILLNLSGNGTFSPATYVGLFTTAPTETSTGVEVPTTVGGNSTGYARQLISTASWEYIEGSRLLQNKSSIGFTNALQNWGTVVAIGLFDRATPTSNPTTDPDLLWFSELSTPIPVNSLNSVSIAANTLLLRYAGSSIVHEPFDYNVSDNYVLDSNSAAMQGSMTFDRDFGYRDRGSLRVDVTTEADSLLRITPTSYQAASPTSSYGIRVTAYTTNAAIVPEVAIQFYDANYALITLVEEVQAGVPTIQADRWQLHSTTVTQVPSNAAYCKPVLLISSEVTGQTGSVWFDDFRVTLGGT